MGYRRETLVMRLPGGQRAGFLVWERGARQGSLRCNLDGLPADEEVRLLWMAEGSFALFDGGALQADESGAVRRTLLIAGDTPLIGVVLARGDGSLYAHAFVQGVQKEAVGGAERLQALLEAQQPKAVRTQALPREDSRGPVPSSQQESQAAPEQPPADASAQRERTLAARVAPVAAPAPTWPQALEPHRAAFFRMDALGAPEEAGPAISRVWQGGRESGGLPRGLALHCDALGTPERLEALWVSDPWPPPPGLPGTAWRDGCWAFPVDGGES